MKITRQSIFENLLVLVIFTGGMLPLRLIFYQNLSHYWLGSLGVLSIFTFTIFYLSQKNKLGKIGYIIIKKVQKRAKGKTGLSFMVLTILIIYAMGLCVVACIFANPELVKSVDDINVKNNMTKLDLETFDRGLKADSKLPPIEIISALLIAYTPNPVTFAVIKSIDDMSNGWIYSIALVFLVEEIEYLGILCYLRYVHKYKIQDEQKQKEIKK